MLNGRRPIMHLYGASEVINFNENFKSAFYIFQKFKFISFKIDNFIPHLYSCCQSGTY